MVPPAHLAAHPERVPSGVKNLGRTLQLTSSHIALLLESALGPLPELRRLAGDIAREEQARAFDGTHEVRDLARAVLRFEDLATATRQPLYRDEARHSGLLERLANQGAELRWALHAYREAVKPEAAPLPEKGVDSTPFSSRGVDLDLALVDDGDHRGPLVRIGGADVRISQSATEDREGPLRVGSPTGRAFLGGLGHPDYTGATLGSSPFKKLQSALKGVLRSKRAPDGRLEFFDLKTQRPVRANHEKFAVVRGGSSLS